MGTRPEMKEAILGIRSKPYSREGAKAKLVEDSISAIFERVIQVDGVIASRAVLIYPFCQDIEVVLGPGVWHCRRNLATGS